MKASLLFCLYLLLTFQINGQSIDNVKATLSDDKVHISFDLIASLKDQKFDIEVFSSINEYTTPLKSVTGDVGENVFPGKGKKIIWSPEDELGQFEGDVTFEIKALIINPPVKEQPPIVFKNPTDGAAFKRGKLYQINWEGLNNNDSNVSLELIRNGVKQKDIGYTSKPNEYSWFVPQNSKPGSDYQIKIETGNNQRSSMSPVFKIKRKVPLVLKIAPVIIIGGVVAAITSGGSGGSEPGAVVTPPPTSDPLPNPPPPPGN